jgi:hypothetical protein
MDGRFLRTAAAAVGLLVLTGCGPDSSSTNQKTDAGAAQPAVAQEPVLAKTAFYEMYKSAHTWAADLTPLALESKEIPGIKNTGGKAAMWSATFGSPSKHEARVFSYAVAAHAPDVYQGITVGSSRPWNGPVPSALPFDGTDVSVDSDAAYQAALAQASAWVNKNPEQSVSFTLGNASRFSGPVWYVLWGDKKSGHAVYVSAKTGAIVK